MTADAIWFFQNRTVAMELYELFERRVLSEIEDVRIKVQKTQISFYNRHLFACVSMLAVRPKAGRPEEYIVVTFGTGEPIYSPRIDAVVEPYPGRWTHHVTVAEPEEIDGELIGWVREAAVYAANKR